MSVTAHPLSTLEDIYAGMDETAFSPYTPIQLMEAEREEESRQLTVNPSVKSIIDRRRAAGDRIVFISDMYLPSAFLSAILRREGCLSGDDDRVAVSCESGARKDDGGRLYAEVSGGRLTRWTHYGDNAYSDVRMARRQGLHACRVDSGFTGVERAWLSAADRMRDGWQLSVLAGLSRSVRIAGCDTPLLRFAADFVAPAYIPYVMDVMEEARTRGIRRLYFLSRDSYILYKIAEQLPHEGIELSYLFVSRKSLTQPFMHKWDESRLLSIMDRNTLTGSRVDDLLGQLHLERGALRESYGIDFPYHVIRSGKEARHFMDAVFHTAELVGDAEAAASAAFRLTEDYFRQEGLLDGEPTGMVDVGWLGTTRLMINDLLTHMGAERTTFFYMGVRHDVMSPASGDYVSYNLPGQLDTMATALIENYFSASPYPSTVGYHKAPDGRVEPSFAPGTAVKGTEVTDTNVNVAVTIAREVAQLDNLSPAVLYEWSRSALHAVATDSHGDIDYSPLLYAGAFDGKPMAKRMSVMDLVKFTGMGKHVTVFDRGSVVLTMGHWLGRRLWGIHCISSALRGKLYRLYLKIHR